MPLVCTALHSPCTLLTLQLETAMYVGRGSACNAVKPYTLIQIAEIYAHVATTDAILC